MFEDIIKIFRERFEVTKVYHCNGINTCKIIFKSPFNGANMIADFIDTPTTLFLDISSNRFIRDSDDRDVLLQEIKFRKANFFSVTDISSDIIKYCEYIVATVMAFFIKRTSGIEIKDVG